jgi:hypothetical protein
MVQVLLPIIDFLWFKFYRQSSIFPPIPQAIPAISLKSTDNFRPLHFGAQTKHSGITVTRNNKIQTRVVLSLLSSNR